MVAAFLRLLTADGVEHQAHDGGQVGNHQQQFRRDAKGLQHIGQSICYAEDRRRKGRAKRMAASHGFRCDANEAAARHHIPHKAAGIGHGHEHSAKGGEHAGEGQGDQLDPVGIFPYGFRRHRVFAHRPNPKAQRGLIQEHIHDDDADNGQVGKKAVAREDLPQNGDVLYDGDVDVGHRKAGQAGGGALGRR